MGDNNNLKETVKENKGLDINVKFFITSCLIIFVLMCLVYAMTFIIPGGEYVRTVDAEGNTVIDTVAGFSYVEGGIPFWKWILSPILVLSVDGSGTIISIIAFLLVVGGVFNVLDKCGLMQRILKELALATVLH